MREQLQQRLEQLKMEFEAGQGHLEEMERQAAFVRETMLRISGAIQVLEELLSSETLPAANGGEPVGWAAGQGCRHSGAVTYGGAAPAVRERWPQLREW